MAIEYARQGGLVTISAHLYNPANPKGGGLRDQGADFKKILTPGNETHDRWMKELDIMAAGLKELQDAGVVVLWRPFHEMNGGWFWWGAKEPETFIRVWRQMFDYFTKTKGLNNLLWVYSPNHGDKTADYYAGDQYVDIVGLDAYTDFVDPQHIRGYDAVAKLPKPFGFTEFGPHGPHNPPGDYDYTRFIDGVQKHFPKTTFFLAWHRKWSLGRNQNAKQLRVQPRIALRISRVFSVCIAVSDPRSSLETHRLGFPFPVRPTIIAKVLSHRLYTFVPTFGNDLRPHLEHFFRMFFTPKHAVVLQTEIDYSADAALDGSTA